MPNIIASWCYYLNCFLWKNKSIQFLRKAVKKLGLPYPTYASTKELEKKRGGKKKVNNKHESDVGGRDLFLAGFFVLVGTSQEHGWKKEKANNAMLSVVSVICSYKRLFFLHPFFFVSIFSDVTALEIYTKLRILSKWYNRIYIFVKVINSKNSLNRRTRIKFY